MGFKLNFCQLVSRALVRISGYFSSKITPYLIARLTRSLTVDSEHSRLPNELQTKSHRRAVYMQLCIRRISCLAARQEFVRGAQPAYLCCTFYAKTMERSLYLRPIIYTFRAYLISVREIRELRDFFRRARRTSMPRYHTLRRIINEISLFIEFYPIRMYADKNKNSCTPFKADTLFDNISRIKHHCMQVERMQNSTIRRRRRRRSIYSYLRLPFRCSDVNCKYA